MVIKTLERVSKNYYYIIRGESMHSGLKPIIYMFRMTISIIAVWIREKILKLDKEKIRGLEMVKKNEL